MTHHCPNSLHARDIAAVLHPRTNARRHEQERPFTVDHGSGIWITDEQGKHHIEAASALWRASLGFSNERLARVAHEAMKKLGCYQIFRHAWYEATIELCERLLAPVPTGKVLLQCSGSQATTPRSNWCRIIGTLRAGRRSARSPAAWAAITNRPAPPSAGPASPTSTMEFGLPLDGFPHAECPYCFRDRTEGESEETPSTRMADALEALILRGGPETVAAFCADPVQGAFGALLPGRGGLTKV